MDSVIWRPRQTDTRMDNFIQSIQKRYKVELKDYAALHQWSISDISRFWTTISEYFDLPFHKTCQQVLSPHKHPLKARWFEGSSFNFAEQLLQGHDSETAIICVNEREESHTLTYAALRSAVAACAEGMKALGLRAGDRVAAVLPNTHYAVIAMLASASIGAVWASCSPDFGAQAIIDRLGQINPRLLFICDGHFYNGKTHLAKKKIQTIVAALPQLEAFVLCPNVGGELPMDSDCTHSHWKDFLRPAKGLHFDSLPFDHPLYILFSSGTTGVPKCMVHGAGGTLLQHIKELALHSDMRPGDRHCFYTTTGWMMWNWMVSSLAVGATIVLYEGSPTTPDPFHLFSVIERYKVTHFGTGAKFLSALEKAAVTPSKRFTLASLRVLFSTGSPLLPKNYDFVIEKIKANVQLCSISGGSDIISCFALGCPILPVHRGEIQAAGLGMDIAVYNRNGQSVVEQKGELVCQQAFPSMPIYFWNDPDKNRYFDAYFSRFDGIWAHGDYASITAHQGVIIYGRSDAVLNPGGVRIGTAEIYRQVEKVSEVIDAVVIGQPYKEDERVVLFVKLQEEQQLDHRLDTKIKQLIRSNTSPRHVPALILQVEDIPRTLSGKTVEIAVKQTVCHEEVQNKSSLANPEALEYFKNIPELN